MKHLTRLTLITGLATVMAGTMLVTTQPASAAPVLIAQRCDDAYPTRIQFQPGTHSELIVGQASSCNPIGRYVLRAYAGQKMTVTANSPDTPIPLYLTIYGSDGTILVRDVVQNSSWSGKLPRTEDYYINVVSGANFLPDYHLDVVIR